MNQQISIFNIVCNNLSNAGDRYAAVTDYFDFENCIINKICITNKNSIFSSIPTNSIILIGGGGVYVNSSMMNYLSENFSDQVISWGCGFNYHFNWDKNINYLENYNPESRCKFFNKFLLNGIRDYIKGSYWVPCATCIHPFFNISINNTDHLKKHNFVVYGHTNYKDAGYLKLISDTLGFPYLENIETLSDIINFLLSGDVIITNSYHGVFWGGLLNRKIICVPFSDRFLNFKNNVYLEYDLKKLLDICYIEKISKSLTVDTNFLQICRERNISFSKIVSKLIGINIKPKLKIDIREITQEEKVASIKYLEKLGFREIK